jgi:predicted Zn-dependent peptidase
LVGDIKPDELIKMVKKYFDRIPHGKVNPPDIVTLEEKQYGEKRLITEAETSPRSDIWFHTVAWKNKDSYPLKVMAGVMSGKTGRLYKKLVEEKGIAMSSGGGGSRMFGGDNLGVSATQDSRKYAGAFQISAEGIAGVKAEQLEAAMNEVIDDLKTNPVSAEELQKVKNQLRVQNIRFMDIMSGLGIVFTLIQNAGMGDWNEVNNDSKMCDSVTADDIKRVANTYFTQDQRNVMLINTKASQGGKDEGADDPRLAQFIQMIQQMKDPVKLEQMIGMFSSQMDQVTDPKEKGQMEKLLKVANDHLKELKAAGQK